MSDTPLIRIAFFDAKPYDRESFDKINQDFNYKISYFKGHLSPETVPLTRDFDAVCVFVHDEVNEKVIDILMRN